MDFFLRRGNSLQCFEQHRALLTRLTKGKNSSRKTKPIRKRTITVMKYTFKKSRESEDKEVRTTMSSDEDCIYIYVFFKFDLLIALKGLN